MIAIGAIDEQVRIPTITYFSVADTHTRFAGDSFVAFVAFVAAIRSTITYFSVAYTDTKFACYSFFTFSTIATTIRSAIADIIFTDTHTRLAGDSCAAYAAGVSSMSVGLDFKATRRNGVDIARNKWQ